MAQKFILDWDIYYSKDRLKAISYIPLETLSPLELETVINYVIYGKDEDDKSSVDRKEIQIKPKFSSYQKEKTCSLDELMESPTFDENTLKKDRTKYKNVKPKIDREKAKVIPGMEELWTQIDHLDKVLAANEGKIPFSPEIPKLSQQKIYLLKHHLIQIKTQQYYLYDSYFPAIQLQGNRTEAHRTIDQQQLNYPVLPRGVMREKNDIDFRFPRCGAYNDIQIYTEEEVEELKKSGKPYFDFREPEHLYQLILNYWDIIAENSARPDSPLHNLIWTLDFYIEKANLSEQQRFIIECKKKRFSNKAICAALQKELNISHQENYISTIWNKSLGLVAAAAELNYDEYLCKDYDKAWKVCTKCGRELLRDPRNFVRKAKAADGLTNKCKQCDKAARKGEGGING